MRLQVPTHSHPSTSTFSGAFNPAYSPRPPFSLPPPFSTPPPFILLTMFYTCFLSKFHLFHLSPSWFIISFLSSRILFFLSACLLPFLSLSFCLPHFFLYVFLSFLLVDLSPSSYSPVLFLLLQISQIFFTFSCFSLYYFLLSPSLCSFIFFPSYLNLYRQLCSTDGDFYLFSSDVPELIKGWRKISLFFSFFLSFRCFLLLSGNVSPITSVKTKFIIF